MNDFHWHFRTLTLQQRTFEGREKHGPGIVSRKHLFALNAAHFFEFTKKTWRYVALRGPTAGGRQGASDWISRSSQRGLRKTAVASLQFESPRKCNYCRVVLRWMRHADCGAYSRSEGSNGICEESEAPSCTGRDQEGPRMALTWKARSDCTRPRTRDPEPSLQSPLCRGKSGAFRRTRPSGFRRQATSANERTSNLPTLAGLKSPDDGGIRRRSRNQSGHPPLRWMPGRDPPMRGTLPH